MTRGNPTHPDVDSTLQAAKARIHRFAGQPRLQPDALTFTKAVVLDALAVAPAPVEDTWTAFALSAISGLVRWVDRRGEPLTREHVLSEETVFRYMSTPEARKWHGGTRDNYLGKIELIRDFLLTGDVSRKLTAPMRKSVDAKTPLTGEEQADLWVWATHFPTPARRRTFTTLMALGLGCGLNLAQSLRVTKPHVTVHSDGRVEVLVCDQKVGDTGRTHTVTCLREWESRLAELVNEVPENRYLLKTRRDASLPAHDFLAPDVWEKAKSAPVPWSTVRMRNTWLVHHLNAGTPIDVLCAGAGVTGAHALKPLMRYVTARPDAASLLRGPSL